MKHKFLNKWLSENWTVGQYTPTQDFQEIQNHSCVCREHDKGLVSLSGPADDLESQALSDLVSAAPEMLDLLEQMSSASEDANINLNSYLSDWSDRMNTIIKKARGEK